LHTGKMKAAFATWNNRIAPVFDVAPVVSIVEAKDGRLVGEPQEARLDGVLMNRVRRLVELGVDTLVCGAISRPLHDMVASQGVRLIPFVAGDLDKVVRAWLNGELAGGAFAMPGCYRRRRHRFHGMRGR
jgi:predicted Fe-Mo cluster-binding NifX family protein